MKIYLIFPAVLLLASQIALSSASEGKEIVLATDGRTNYRIVHAADTSGVDLYSAQTLAAYLRESTGAEFAIVGSDQHEAGKPAIFVGLSQPSRAFLGGDPFAGLADQEHVVRSAGPDIFLYGKGPRGNLYAVMEFLENSIGWRWYSFFEKPVVPKHPNMMLQPFHRKRVFDFESRQLPLRYNPDFFLQHAVNMGLETKLIRNQQSVRPHLRSWMRNENFVHTSISYIPPTPTDQYAGEFPWVAKRNYFETNPEFFSLDERGKRVPNLQLCYGNRGLRDELTAQVRRHLAISGEHQIITIDAADRPGRFCHCRDCTVLEKLYQTPGGPLIDYLIELADILTREHPQTMLKTLAYRRSQTQIPPRLPGDERLPGNLIIAFAPIEDCYFADFSHPDPAIQETCRNLKDWAAITAPGNLWAWMYPNPWGTGHVMPVGNVERVVTNMRLMHQAGVRGIFLDHNGINSRSGWSELQAFLVLKLAQDIHADTGALMNEFTDSLYGAAAPQVRQYLGELENARKDMKTFAPGITYKSQNFDDRTFPYLTPENIHRWQKSFDRMGELTADSPRHRTNVEVLRRELDIATLWKWFALKRTYPDSYANHLPVTERIAAANVAKSSAGIKPAWKLGEEAVADFVTEIEAGGEKPLPAQFAGIGPERIRTFLPKNSVRGDSARTVKDPGAAFGLGVIVDQPGDPFRCGFSEWKSRVPRDIVHGPRLELATGQVTPGRYQLHRLGDFDVTTGDSLIWFGRSWATAVDIGSRLHFPGEISRWEAWVSLKFTGPAWGGEGEDQVVCDRVILVRKNEP